jgi:hypothetical protein
MAPLLIRPAGHTPDAELQSVANGNGDERMGHRFSRFFGPADAEVATNVRITECCHLVDEHSAARTLVRMIGRIEEFLTDGNYGTQSGRHRYS